MHKKKINFKATFDLNKSIYESFLHFLSTFSDGNVFRDTLTGFSDVYTSRNSQSPPTEIM